MSKEKIVVQQNTQKKLKTSDLVKEDISGPVISEENKQTEIELKKQKEKENNKSDEKIKKKSSLSIAIKVFLLNWLALSMVATFSQRLYPKYGWFQGSFLANIIFSSLIIYVWVVTISFALFYYFLAKKKKWLKIIIVVNILFIIFSFTKAYNDWQHDPYSPYNKEKLYAMQDKIEKNFPNIDCPGFVSHGYMEEACYNYLLSKYKPPLNLRECESRFNDSQSILDCTIKTDNYFYKDGLCDKLYPKCYEYYFEEYPITYLSHINRPADYDVTNCYKIKEEKYRYNCFYYAFNFDLRKNDRSICNKVEETGFEEQCNLDIDQTLLTQLISSTFKPNGPDYSYSCDFIRNDELKSKCVRTALDNKINQINDADECQNLFNGEPRQYCENKILAKQSVDDNISKIIQLLKKQIDSNSFDQIDYVQVVPSNFIFTIPDEIIEMIASDNDSNLYRHFNSLDYDINDFKVGFNSSTHSVKAEFYYQGDYKNKYSVGIICSADPIKLMDAFNSLSVDESLKQKLESKLGMFRLWGDLKESSNNISCLIIPSLIK